MERVPFIGCPGERIKTLVTDLGVFKKLGNDKTFTLTKYFSSPSIQEKEDRLREIQEKCGWEVKTADVLEEIPPPTPEELGILRSLDPKGLFIGS